MTASAAGGGKRFTFSFFPTKVRYRIMQYLEEEMDVLRFLQIEGACRDVLYVYPECVFARYRHIDQFPWISSFPKKRDQIIRQSWHSPTGRWAVVLLDDAPQPDALPPASSVAERQLYRRTMTRKARYDALLLDLQSKALVTSRIIHPPPRNLASGSKDDLPDWSDIVSASFTKNERYVVTSSRNLTCVCECSKKAIIAVRNHADRAQMGTIERSFVTEDGAYLITIMSLQLTISRLDDPDRNSVTLNRPRRQSHSPWQCRYHPTTQMLLVIRMGTSIEWYDLSKRYKEPYLCYRFTGPSVDPVIMNEPPVDPSGRKLLMTKSDGSGNAVLQDLRHVLIDGKRALQKPFPLIHSDIGGLKRWTFSDDGRWLLLITSCCEHLVRMWDLSRDFTKAEEIIPAEMDPEDLFDIRSGGLQFKGTTGNFVICANFTIGSKDVADAILIFNTITRDVKTVSTAGCDIHKTCPGTATVSQDGNCLVTSCEARDEVRTWLVPEKADMLPPQIQLQNHRSQPMPREARDPRGQDLLKEAKRMQLPTITAQIASSEYFVLTTRNNVLVPASPSPFFSKTFKEHVRSLRTHDRTVMMKITKRTIDRLWELYRSALVRKNFSKVDALLSAGDSTIACLAGLPQTIFKVMWETATMEMILRNPEHFQRCYSSQPISAPLTAARSCSSLATKRKAIEGPKVDTRAAKAPAHECLEPFTMLPHSNRCQESLWLYRPSLHLLGRSEVVELLVDDYAATEDRTLRFSQDGLWVLGGPRLYNLKDVEGYLQEKASFETDTLNAVGCLNELMDRLSCSCKSCSKIAHSLAALVGP